MAKLIKTKRGLDIQMEGKAKEITGETIISTEIALIPDYYHGIIPKMMVREGDAVKAGTPVFYDKNHPEVYFVSPVSGTVKAINRGERRKILSIVVNSDGKNTSESFKLKSPDKLSTEEVKSALLTSGLWPYIKQRPYDVIANPNGSPKAIFISTFDSAPLAASNDYVIGSQMKDFQTGIDALKKLCPEINLGIKSGNTVFNNVSNVTITEFDGPHPVGNVGIQINKLNPVNKGEVVWTINAQDVLYIGRLFNNGVVDLTRQMALAGPEVNAPQYYNVIPGSPVKLVTHGKLSSGILHCIICGNVLSGIEVSESDYIDPYSTQITVIHDGSDVHELVGWAMPRFNKFSASGTFFTGIFESKIYKSIFGQKKYDYDTRLLGGKRAIIMSGEYDKVLPMDILPEYLFKAMITGNIDKMEALGAYEIAPEDVALCEYVCTSKLPLQKIVRDSLDNLKSELE